MAVGLGLELLLPAHCGCEQKKVDMMGGTKMHVLYQVLHNVKIVPFLYIQRPRCSSGKQSDTYLSAKLIIYSCSGFAESGLNSLHR